MTDARLVVPYEDIAVVETSEQPRFDRMEIYRFDALRPVQEYDQYVCSPRIYAILT